MDTNASYIPTQSDIAWLRGVISMLKNGGVIGFPSTLLVYRLDIPRHELVLISPPEVFEDEDARETHARTICVAAAIGYEVREERLS